MLVTQTNMPTNLCNSPTHLEMESQLSCEAHEVCNKKPTTSFYQDSYFYASKGYKISGESTYLVQFLEESFGEYSYDNGVANLMVENHLSLNFAQVLSFKRKKEDLEVPLLEYFKIHLGFDGEIERGRGRN